eukprot:5917427-Pleurochrysis_carterae.AAC.2
MPPSSADHVIANPCEADRGQPPGLPPRASRSTTDPAMPAPRHLAPTTRASASTHRSMRCFFSLDLSRDPTASLPSSRAAWRRTAWTTAPRTAEAMPTTRLLRCHFASPPCSTLSVSRFFSTLDSPYGGRPPVRDRDHVLGLPYVPAQHARELAQANELVRRTAQLLHAASAAGAEFILEHPADRGALSSPLFLHMRHAPIWLMPDIQALRANCSASLILFP